MPSTILTRQALYTQVWSEPTSHIAERFGLSDRGLGKLCERHDIPVPPRGWWAKKHAGHPVEPTPLPPGGNAHITIEPKPTVAPLSSDTEAELRIVVPEHITRYHPLVETTRQVLKTVKPGTPPDRPLLVPREKSLHVAVSKPLVSRALRIMDTFVRALEERGYQPTLPTKGAGLQLTIDGQQLYVGLKEKCKKQVRPRTDWEQRGFEEGWITSEPYTLVPSGALALQIRGTANSKWVSYELIERPTKPLEGSLNRFISKLQQDAAESNAREAKWERERREAAERESQRQEAEALRVAEQKRAAQWDSWMTSWKKSQEVRAFAKLMEERLGPAAEGSELAGWLDWAGRYAERLDPLRRGRL